MLLPQKTDPINTGSIKEMLEMLNQRMAKQNRAFQVQMEYYNGFAGRNIHDYFNEVNHLVKMEEEEVGVWHFHSAESPHATQRHPNKGIIFGGPNGIRYTPGAIALVASDKSALSEYDNNEELKEALMYASLGIALGSLNKSVFSEYDNKRKVDKFDFIPSHRVSIANNDALQQITIPIKNSSVISNDNSHT